MIFLKQKYFGACRTHMFNFVLNVGTAGYTWNAYMQRIYPNLSALVHVNMQVTAPCFRRYTSSGSTHYGHTQYITCIVVQGKGKLYSVLYKLQYILMHWAIMHKTSKTKYTELDNKCWPDVCSTTLRTELSTYVERMCREGNVYWVLYILHCTFVHYGPLHTKLL